MTQHYYKIVILILPSSASLYNKRNRFSFIGIKRRVRTAASSLHNLCTFFSKALGNKGQLGRDRMKLLSSTIGEEEKNR